MVATAHPWATQQGRSHSIERPLAKTINWDSGWNHACFFLCVFVHCGLFEWIFLLISLEPTLPNTVCFSWGFNGVGVFFSNKRSANYHSEKPLTWGHKTWRFRQMFKFCLRTWYSKHGYILYTCYIYRCICIKDVCFTYIHIYIYIHVYTHIIDIYVREWLTDNSRSKVLMTLLFTWASWSVWKIFSQSLQ